MSKTKEVVFDFRKTKSVFEPIYINDTRVEIVDNFKYLGTIIDSNLNWKINTQELSGMEGYGAIMILKAMMS